MKATPTTATPATVTLTFWSDPGHGWLEVQETELVRLGIEEQITHFSYRKEGRVFLEEDKDAYTFIEAKRRACEDFEIKERNSARSDSWIRNLPPYTPRPAVRTKPFTPAEAVTS